MRRIATLSMLLVLAAVGAPASAQAPAPAKVKILAYGKVARDGSVRVVVRSPGAGTIFVALLGRRDWQPTQLGSGTATATKAGRLAIVAKIRATGRALLRRKHAMPAKLDAVYAPDDVGAQASKAIRYITLAAR